MSTFDPSNNPGKGLSTTSLLHLTALSDDSCEGKSKPYCYILEIDNTKLLLDCGSVVTNNEIVPCTSMHSLK